MNRPNWKHAPLSLALALPLLAGCSTDSSVLARVGNRTITVGEFREVAGAASTRYMMPPDSAKRLLLDDLIRRELMLAAAETDPTMIDSLVARRRELVEEEVLSRALVAELAPNPAGVSDAEVRRLYALQSQETNCQIVFTQDAASARVALEGIRRGEDFGVVAERFDVGQLLPPRGELGFVPAGMLIQPLDGVVRDTPVGEIAGPLEAPGEGWFIVRILERRERQQPPFEQEAPKLRSMLEQRKQRVLLVRAYQKLVGAYRVKTDPNGIRVLFERFGAPQLVRQMGAQPPAVPLTPQEAAIVLARWDGGPRFRGTYTLAMAARDLDRGLGQRINPSHMLSFEQWVRAQTLQRVAILEAHRRHLHEQPEVARQIEETVNNYLLETLYNAEVERKSEPSGPDLQTVYERNLPSLGALRSARVQYMTFRDSSGAAGAMTALRGASSIAEAVVVASPSMQVRDERLTFPSSDPMWSRLQPVLTQQPLKTLIGPIPVDGGWRIVQLLERDIQAPPLDQLQPELRQALIEQARQASRDRRLTFYTDSLRRVLPVTVNDGLLHRLRWPTAPNLMVG